MGQLAAKGSRRDRASCTRLAVALVGGIVLPAWVAPASADPGDLVVADGAAISVVRIDPGTGGQTVVASGGLIDFPRAIAVEARGDLLVGVDDGSVVRVDPATGAQSTVSSGALINAIDDMTLDPGGNILVVDSGFLSLFRIDPVTGNETTVSFGGSFVVLAGVAVENTGDIVVADAGADALFRVDPGTGAQSTISSGGSLLDPIDVAVESSGDLVVVNAGDGAVIRVDPGTGAQTTLSPSGGVLGSPQSITVDDTGTIFVADTNTIFAQPGVVRVDPTTGGQALVSGAGNLVFPFGIAVEPEPACGPIPRLGCSFPGRSVLVIRDHPTDDGRDRAAWRWLRGTAAVADFGSPETSTGFGLCVYDDGAIAFEARVDFGGTCDGNPCWKPLGTRGFRYRSRQGNGDGLTRIVMKDGGGNARLLLKGKGASLAPPSLPLTVGSKGVEVQLFRHDASECWAANFPSFKKNTGDKFRAISP